MVAYPNMHKQRGLSVSGLILILVVLGLGAVIGMQVVPAVIEYQSIKKAANDARNNGHSVIEIQASFDKQANAGYITAISGKDLTIARNADGYDVSFAYDKKLPLFGPASLLLEFSGSTDKHH